jgi:hypothetical protein
LLAQESRTTWPPRGSPALIELDEAQRERAAISAAALGARRPYA